MPKLTVIGIYGSTLDAGGKRRWELLCGPPR